MSFGAGEPSAYGVDSDPDSDFDPEERNPNNMKCVAQILATNHILIIGKDTGI
jgi:hypothetical protein